MKPSVLRDYVRRYGNSGVLMVGLYLGMRHLWTRRRIATISGVCVLLPVGMLFYRHLVFRTPAEAVHASIFRPARVEKSVRSVPPTTLPYGKSIFSRARRILSDDQVREKGNQDAGEYLWLSDTELFFTEEVLSGTKDTQYRGARCYRYDLRTGKKTRLKRLEQTSSFLSCQVQVSPDGKRLLWFKDSTNPQTLQTATLDGRNYRQWPFNTNGESGRGWARDSRHWIELERPHHEEPPVEITVHDAIGSADDRRVTSAEDNFESPSCVYGFGNSLVTIQEPNSADVTPSLEVVVASLPPHIRRIRTEKIVLPHTLPHPNIVAIVLSPDAERVAMIVGYGADLPKSYSLNQSDTQNAANRDYSLLVCRADGSEMHSVGDWQETNSSDAVLELNGVRWLPSGKQLSFCYKGALYTVPAFSTGLYRESR